jgi:ribonuclease HI
MDFPTTNNEAEYEAVLAGLGIAKDLGAKNLEVRSDSQVIVGHIQGDYEARGDKMIKYLAKVQESRAFSIRWSSQKSREKKMSELMP